MSDIMITGGADACITPGILGAFCQIGATCTSFNSNPTKASRPFNKDRDGFVLSEGAWMFIFEELEHALRRGRTIYGEVAGYAATCDAYHMSRPLPSGQYSAEAMTQALEDAAIRAEEVDYINAYGNATRVNDSYETMVIHQVFGDHAKKLMVSSIKSMIGHSIGSCGAGGVAASLMALSEGIVPPTINYEVPDPECDLDYVPNQARIAQVKVAMCNTLAFGSKNAVLILKKYNPQTNPRTPSVLGH
jgi:3-oxoacyl-[acyl-carrier-protein] synthase II